MKSFMMAFQLQRDYNKTIDHKMKTAVAGRVGSLEVAWIRLVSFIPNMWEDW